ncbi:MAG: UDP-N-acetylglucosamine 1-carboxyvinyltransferase [Candidatus Beckwithbacteria bacterium GW2011_GWA2_43_10]|uniref:UDP-N-acetylglucosamine 1-carboxyvinyltransferase n=1 Tax=Candidatus Beckwithbacteria bacterium GW2011_GWA2_43_10 TaxID=1618369 RepID=A0A0G1C388_9BACT|nr:MAG: UDP-N-acetylglucosamine 1-carboxyvinyltransferase [Candidatus Beckwithbacteria bacterium GW2011_GWA2_43_10]
MVTKLIIESGIPLKGVVRLGGAKNSSYKLMIASLLCSHENRLLNFSRIADVELVKQIIQKLGPKIYSAGERTMFINAAQLHSSIIPHDLGLASRASSLFIAPLLARTKKALVPLPGGDKIGFRPLDRHFNGLKALGVKLEIKNNLIHANCPQLVGNSYSFIKPTHTGTETMIMAAVLARGKTVLHNTALEPEIDDLINFLKQMGAKITRLANRVIEIEGVKKLKPVIYKIMPDRNEAVSYAIAALITRGDIIVENAREKDLTAFLAKLEKTGAGIEKADYGLRFFYQKPLTAVDIITRPHPGFMTDWQPLWSVLATQCQGTSRIIETVFTSRFQFVKDLQLMGAKVEFFQPQVDNLEEFYNFNLPDDQPVNFHGLKVSGITPLIGKTITVNDLRAGATLALAGLVAQGKTVLTGLEHIDRGYENFAGRLLKLGAKIKRINQ